MTPRGPGVVMDTHVWMCGLLMKAGARADLVRQVVRLGQPVFSPDTFTELKQRLWLPKFDRFVSMEHRKRLLHDIDGAARWVEAPQPVAARVFTRDEAADKFIHAALAAGGVWVVTGYQDLLALSESLTPSGVRIVTPSDALLSRDFLRRV